ncbi:hypothetical protein BD769DRAFT_1389599 [Suillus cothurnatus]|nr:hypothetical protein BD769DRAFT_1389599 [Suillus cothurnatus]
MSASDTSDSNVHVRALVVPDSSGVIPTSADARAKRRIAALKEELDTLRQEKGTKQRVIRRMVALYTSLEDLIAENDRRQDRLQRGYIAFAQALPWMHDRLTQLDIDDAEDMLKKLKRGADAARGDDTSTLKDLVASWLLCPAEWDWNNNRVKAGIRDRTLDFIVSENSWPLFLYESYVVNPNNLEQGLFKSKILVQAFKAIFTSPSSAREADGDGDGADILENSRRARRQLNQVKVKTCVASIINMRKVSPRTIAYVICQVRFALSSVTSWRTVDGDFDYEIFWNNIVDFFEAVPGPAAQRRVTKLLEWWTRKVFGRRHREDLTPEVVSKMSVTALADQRLAQEDAAFDSD